jgi:3-oxoacyl-[acyl-carrier protein] reductase
MSKRVLITGASRGIGYAIADLYQQHDYEVIAPTRQELDLSSVESIENYMSDLEKCSPDILINNAAINKIDKIESMTIEDWKEIMAVNLDAPFLLTKFTIPHMVDRQWGRIVNISSCYGLISRIGRAAYSTSKAGINGLTKTTALECATDGILVNSVCPGFVETDMTRQNNNPEQIENISQQIPLQRLANPKEIANLVFFLGSEKNSYITGQNMTIDGGLICK